MSEPRQLQLVFSRTGDLVNARLVRFLQVCAAVYRAHDPRVLSVERQIVLLVEAYGRGEVQGAFDALEIVSGLDLTAFLNSQQNAPPGQAGR